LPGDRVQPGRELELRLPDEHEILDAQSSQHRSHRRVGTGPRPLAKDEESERCLTRDGAYERQRLVLFLRYYADLDYAAIADTLGIGPGTVGASLNHAHAAFAGPSPNSRSREPWS